MTYQTYQTSLFERVNGSLFRDQIRADQLCSISIYRREYGEEDIFTSAACFRFIHYLFIYKDTIQEQEQGTTRGHRWFLFSDFA